MVDFTGCSIQLPDFNLLGSFNEFELADFELLDFSDLVLVESDFPLFGPFNEFMLTDFSQSGFIGFSLLESFESAEWLTELDR